ncbi:hypothetical protein EBE87_12155 [Pseudoroseomonas wenyumeiae]|uniref:DUF4852 domain-containing protein n=2 Tax=Teichococcus wenyumeiae TaxID=2478470 RepID=A0A3A9JH91_9PROT|nr:hypothetical protein D6Z83_12185 [Pseudoroseomonas wenyumeiae]RMI24883.1 hypothetical protein EBE87_12155 [Pseudoroseomonas wenyumeiae]
MGLMACLALLAGTGPSVAQNLVQGRPAARQAAPADTAGFRAPQLDATMATIAFHRLNGSTPDFNRQAETSQAYRSATAFDRDQVRARERSRLEAQFRAFDLSRDYLVRVSTTLNQYDLARRGYAIPFNEASYVTFYDNTTGRQLGVQIRNVDALNFISIPDVANARDFAQRNNLNMQSDIASSIVLEAVIRLAETGSAEQNSGNPLLIRADAVAARVMTNNGRDARVIHAFSVAPPASASSRLVERPLKAADVQGLRLGMARAEAEALAAAAYPDGGKRQADGATAYFEGLAQGAEPLCGVERDRGSPVQRADGSPVFFSVPDRSAACLALQMDDAKLARIVSGQRLDTATRDEVRAALEEKYGPPSLVQEGGTFLTWQGPDPAIPNSPAVQINARMQEAGTGNLRSVLLGIEVRSARAVGPVAAPARPGGPRL